MSGHHLSGGIQAVEHVPAVCTRTCEMHCLLFAPSPESQQTYLATEGWACRRAWRPGPRSGGTQTRRSAPWSSLRKTAVDEAPWGSLGLPKPGMAGRSWKCSVSSPKHPPDQNHMLKKTGEPQSRLIPQGKRKESHHETKRFMLQSSACCTYGKSWFERLPFCIQVFTLFVQESICLHALSTVFEPIFAKPGCWVLARSARKHTSTSNRPQCLYLKLSPQ